jgi:hypothetical protein
MSMSGLIDFWRSYDPKIPPFIHPEDSKNLGGMQRRFDFDVYNFDTFIASKRFGNSSDNRFHLSLLPTPYAGPISRADIVLLQLNPGFHYTDFYAEYRVPRFAEMKRRAIRQDLDDGDFPFIYLDPEWCWHAGFTYWEGKFRNILQQLAEKRFNHDYIAALRELSSRLLCLELVPYHSPSFHANMRMMLKLPSTKIMRDFVKNDIEPSALRGEKVLIVMRQARSWDIKSNSSKVFVYSRGEARGAHITTHSPPGIAVLNRLLQARS